MLRSRHQATLIMKDTLGQRGLFDVRAIRSFYADNDSLATLITPRSWHSERRREELAEAAAGVTGVRRAIIQRSGAILAEWA